MDAFNTMYPDLLWRVLEFVDDTAYQLDEKKINYTHMPLNSVNDEYGYYLKSKDKTRNIFIGIWLDNWMKTSSPICIVFWSDSPNWKSDYTHYRKLLTKYTSILNNPTLIDDSHDTADIEREVDR